MKSKISLFILCVLILSGCGLVIPIPLPIDEEKSTTQTEESKLSEATANTDNPVSNTLLEESKNLNTDPSMIDIKSYNSLFQFMLEEGNANAILSPESYKIALSLYAGILSEESANEVYAIIDKNKSFLDYYSNDSFKTVNRLWYNSGLPFHMENSHFSDPNITYAIDMSAPDATSIKNKYVENQTNGFINSTPTQFDSSTLLDAMNVIYFKDQWSGGDKILSKDPLLFENEGGDTVTVTSFESFGQQIELTDNAMAFTIDYNDGFSFTTILPNKDSNLSDIDLTSFIDHSDTTIKEADVHFCLPEFESESTYINELSQFGLSTLTFDSSIYSGNYNTSPQISQVAKIKVDHKGTTAASVTEITTLGSLPTEKEKINFICDRPFIYYIRDSLNDDIAFIGVVRKL